MNSYTVTALHDASKLLFAQARANGLLVQTYTDTILDNDQNSPEFKIGMSMRQHYIDEEILCIQLAEKILGMTR